MEIKLLNGTVIEGYAKEQPSQPVDNNLQLDTTSQYLVKDGQEPTQQPENQQKEPLQQSQSRLFTDNAFLLLHNAPRILADSRMFLAPVEGIESGLAYTGTAGFRNPTLGVYIEWWLSCPWARQEEDGSWLVFYLAGSPLTGVNSCELVDPNGRQRRADIDHFSDAWRSFVEINQRYDQAKATCQAYTLQQVLHILTTEA